VHDVARLDVRDLEAIARAFRSFSGGAASMEDVAQRIVHYLYSEFAVEDRPVVVLARLYRTLYVDDLDAEQRRAADRAAAGALQPDSSCLVLVATAGLEPAWNDRRRSKDHAAIPLEDPAAVARSPMIAALFKDLGFDVEIFVQPRSQHGFHNHSGGVFFVPEATDSPVIPAQDEFVRRYGVKSVVGVGGFLPSGELFALIVFLSEQVSQETANLFSTIGLSVKASLTPYTYRTFGHRP
jgi:hypothetical protein